MALSVARTISFGGSQDSTEITQVVETINVNKQEKYTSGVWVRDSVTLAAATDMDLDTYFSDGFGNAVNFATLYELWIHNTDTVKTVAVSGQILTLFQATGAEARTIQPDGYFIETNPTGWTVNDASDVMTLTPSAAGAVVEIFIIGAE